MLPLRESAITFLIQSKLSLRRIYRNWRRTRSLAPSKSFFFPTSAYAPTDDLRARPRRPAQLPAHPPDPNPIPLPLLLPLLYFLALLVRIWTIAYPPSVVFDEVHFLRFVRSYYYGTYFFDIHPPLGKLVLLLITRWFCDAPRIEFDTNGEPFGHQDYIPLRLTSAFFGSFLPPLVYLIAREIGLSSPASLFAAVVQIVEHLSVIESRLVLIDAQLSMWMATCLFLALRMWSRPAGARWHLVVAVALSGAAALGVKWTALATPALVALVSLFGFPFPARRLAFTEMVVAAIVAFTFYTSLFWVHFALLPKSGKGDPFMPRAFQATLKGNKFYNATAPSPGFWSNYAYLNWEMYRANKGIKQRHHWESKWWQWVINQRGLLYYNRPTTSENKDYEKIYLIVNPAVTIITCVALPTFVIIAVTWLIRRWRRKIPAKKSIERRRMHACVQRGAFLFSGFVFNLLPYLEVARCTFLYHYLPALFYAILCTSNLIDVIPSLRVQRVVSFVLIATVLIAFYVWNPWIYALPRSKHEHSQLQLFGKWS